MTAPRPPNPVPMTAIRGCMGGTVNTCSFINRHCVRYVGCCTEALPVKSRLLTVFTVTTYVCEVPSPPRRTQAERRTATRARILDCTSDCLLERGYPATT